MRKVFYTVAFNGIKELGALNVDPMDIGQGLQEIPTTFLGSQGSEHADTEKLLIREIGTLASEQANRNELQ